MNDKGIVGGVIVLLLAIGVILFVVSGGQNNANPTAQAPEGATELAQCLADSGAVFYGAFWCPHCKTQKSVFGSAAKLLPYVECSTPDGKGQTGTCMAKKIESFPTWDFKDGTRVTGELSFSVLAEKSGCKDPSKPAGEAATTTSATQSGSSTTDMNSTTNGGVIPL